MIEPSEQQHFLTPEQKTILENLAQSSNEKLETAGQDSANRAFNVGCSVGLIPAVGLIITTILITQRSWIAIALIGGLMIMGLLAFANLSAYISRSKAYTRVFEHEVQPEINLELEKLGLDPQAFKIVIAETVPAGAPLSTLLFHEN